MATKVERKIREAIDKPLDGKYRLKRSACVFCTWVIRTESVQL